MGCVVQCHRVDRQKIELRKLSYQATSTDIFINDDKTIFHIQRKKGPMTTCALSNEICKLEVIRLNIFLC